MAKIKWMFISVAVICAFVGAFASSRKAVCDSYPQYYRIGNYFYPAGTYGVHYTCQNAPGNCTWYQPNPFDPNSFAPCKMGLFQYAFLKE
jgi:hypothetical protein